MQTSIKVVATCSLCSKLPPKLPNPKSSLEVLLQDRQNLELRHSGPFLAVCTWRSGIQVLLGLKLDVKDLSAHSLAPLGFEALRLLRQAPLCVTSVQAGLDPVEGNAPETLDIPRQAALLQGSWCKQPTKSPSTDGSFLVGA